MRRMFAAIAPRYDLLNHLLSGGLDVLWRRAAARELVRQLETPHLPAFDGGPAANGAAAAVRARTRRGHRVLDLCAGTLDLACALSDTRRFHGKAVALDFALPMLRLGRYKLGGRRSRQIVPLCGDALRLPFPDATFDGAMVAFGMRNLADLERGFGELRRVLVPGGRLLILEFTRPPNAIVRGLYAAYNRNVLPAVGGAISGRPEAYRYLPESMASFPDAQALARRLEETGFDVADVRHLTAGVVALHVARKRADERAAPPPSATSSSPASNAGA